MIAIESLSPDQVAEAQLVAAYVIEKRADIRRSRLKAEHFRNPNFRRWWVAAQESPNGSWKDYGLTVEMYSDMQHSGFLAATSQLPSLEARLIEKHAAGRLAHGVKVIAEDLTSGRVDLEEAMRRNRELLGECQGGSLAEPVTFREAGVGLMEQVFEAATRTNKGELGMSIPMPLERLQARIKGWRLGKFWQVLAATSHHKTTFARQSAQAAAKYFSELGQGKVLIWTMEDAETDIVARGLAAEIDWLDTQMLHGLGEQQGPVAIEPMVQGVGRVLDQEWATRLRIVARTRPTAQEVLGLISAEAARGVRFFVLDYLQLIRRDNPREDFAEFWRNTCNDLQAIAKETNSVLLATVQPTQSSSRDHFQTGARLTKSDIWGGAGISQAAHGIFSLNAMNKHRCKDHPGGRGTGCRDCKYARQNFERDGEALWIVTDKNKDGPRVGGPYRVDPAHDLITDERC